MCLKYKLIYTYTRFLDIVDRTVKFANFQSTMGHGLRTQRSNGLSRMSRSSLYNNWFKLKTSGKLLTIQENLLKVPSMIEEKSVDFNT